MIRFEHVSVTYQDASRPTVTDVSLHVREGEMCLLVGSTGSGKSTLLRAVNGLVPHFTGGTLAGRVLVDGRDTSQHRPRDLADVVGYVGQDPTAGFVADVVEDEIAFGMEWVGLSPPVMRRRVEEALDVMGLADLRRRPLETLSGGQRQRTAIAAALAVGPRVLVLDEPTSALDPQAAEDVFAAVQRLVHDLGLTVLLAEHRLERVIQYVDQVAVLQDGSVQDGGPAEMMAVSPVVPPVVELGRLLGWSPLPLTVRDARRWAARDGALSGLPLEVSVRPAPPPRHSQRRRKRPDDSSSASAEAGRLDRASVRYGPVLALRDVSLAVAHGEAVALMGRNGAGKTTLLHALAGMTKLAAGSATVGGRAAAGLPARELVQQVGLVPQQPTDLLYAATVAQECARSDETADLSPGTTLETLESLSPGIDPAQHPRDLSEGQRLSLALAVVLATAPGLILLDEPTRGLDYVAKHRLIGIIRRLTLAGHAVLLSTHDVELTAAACTRVVVIADGEVVADGPTTTVVTGSPAYAPQVAKIVSPLPLLTVDQVSDALAAPA